jgi:hypothetical protein
MLCLLFLYASNPTSIVMQAFHNNYLGLRTSEQMKNLVITKPKLVCFVIGTCSLMAYSFVCTNINVIYTAVIYR